jgi:ABC-type uncharacterized transport system permease subunit
MIVFLQEGTVVSLVAATLRVATPLLLAGLGALIADRAGMVNLGIEGTMLCSALAGVVISTYTQSATLGLAGAVVIGAMLGFALAGAFYILKADLILSGVALNLGASAGTIMCLYWLTGDKGISSSLHSKVLPNLDIALLDRIPFVSQVLAGQNLMTYVAVLAVPATAFMLTRTTFGLRLRAVGQDAHAAATSGIRVGIIHLLALGLSGAFAGLAGAYLSMGYVSWFAANMSAGRGFIALAAQVMGGSSAYGTAASSLLLGLAEALAIRFQNVGVPNELVQSIPYVVPVVALALYGRRVRRRVATRAG